MARVRKRGDKFVLDYRLNGKRNRVNFEDRHEAEELCDKYNALKRAERLEEFHALLAARNALIDAEIRLTGKSLSESLFEYAKVCSKRKSVQTQKNEKSDFKDLFEFLSKEKSVHFLREVTPPMLLEYQGRLLERVSASTCNRRFNGYKNFFSVCVDWGYLDKSPAKLVKHVKETPNPRKTLTDKETQKIGDILKPNLRRAWFFIALTGVRVGECVSPRVLDWDKENQTIRVYSGKGSELYRIVHLSDQANANIDQALALRTNFKSSDYIFINERNRPLKPAVLTKAVRLARRELGIEEGKTLYGLRHTFATKLARLDVAQEKAKKLMGHSSGRTTEKYYKLEDKDLRETVKTVAKVFDFETRKEIETVTSGHKVG